MIKCLDCVMLFGIPIRSEAYVEASGRDPVGEFVAAHKTLAHYEQVVLNHAVRAVPAITANGVTVVENATLRDLNAACNARFRVVVLFSHASDRAIEFSDEMVPFPTLSSSIPESFDGLLSLAACDVTSNIRRVRSVSQSFLLQTNDYGQNVSVSLYFFAALFTLMKRKGVDYFDAFLRTEELFYKRTG